MTSTTTRSRRNALTAVPAQPEQTPETQPEQITQPEQSAQSEPEQSEQSAQSEQSVPDAQPEPKRPSFKHSTSQAIIDALSRQLDQITSEAIARAGVDDTDENRAGVIARVSREMSYFAGVHPDAEQSKIVWPQNFVPVTELSAHKR
jgi:hypothetical protein